MIELLRSFPQRAIVRAWDADAEEYLPVTGLEYDGETRDVVYAKTDHEP
jgi:hypothetical protein